VPRALALAGAVLLLAPAPAAAAPRHAVIAFLPGSQDGVLRALDARPSLGLGLAGATQGRYSPGQALLDLTSGSRTAPAAFAPGAVSGLGLGPGGRVAGWAGAVRRAASARAEIRPGLLAGSIPGGAAYAGVTPTRDVIAAADLRGRVGAVSTGSAGSLATRVRALERRFALVVVDLPPLPRGGAPLDALLARRDPRGLLVVLRAPPRASGPQLLPIGVAGARGQLTSATTRRAGVVALIDVAPSVLGALGRPVPNAVHGQAIRADGPRDAAALRTLAARWGALREQRIAGLAAFAAAWVVLLVLGAAGGARSRRAVLRAGVLGLLWWPTPALVLGPLDPARGVEIALMVVAPLVLGALTDRAVPWPRAAALPAGVGLLAHTLDLVGGADWTSLSLLGPNPAIGARFYGVGNELEILLVAMLLIGLAAGLPAATPARRAAAAFALGGLGLGIVLAAGRLGADVGGVVTAGVGATVAVLALRPGGLTRRRAAAVLLVPVLGLAALALLDTVTGGEDHFSRTVLHGGAGDLADTLRRRAGLALHALGNGAMPVLVVLALVALGVAARYRRRLLAPLPDAWRAGLLGLLAASVAGTLANDSGPLFLVMGVGALAAALAYLRSPPPARAPGAPPPAPGGGRPQAARPLAAE
jgi:hypothetical protein